MNKHLINLIVNAQKIVNEASKSKIDMFCPNVNDLIMDMANTIEKMKREEEQIEPKKSALNMVYEAQAKDGQCIGIAVYDNKKKSIKVNLDMIPLTGKFTLRGA